MRYHSALINVKLRQCQNQDLFDMKIAEV